jgi:hypothetical protein
MQRSWESEIGGSRPGTEMFGGDYLSRPRPYMGCSAWVDGGTSLILHRSLLLKTRNVSDKLFGDNKNSCFMFSNGFYENRAVYEMLKNTVEPGRLQMTIWRMRIAFWIPKATNTL